MKGIEIDMLVVMVMTDSQEKSSASSPSLSDGDV
jgi:hypothetical protein